MHRPDVGRGALIAGFGLGLLPYWRGSQPGELSYMKRIISIVCGYSVLSLLATGCSHFKGADADTTYQNSGRGTALSDDTEGVNVGSSPSMRPGMNPRDIRDPNGLTRPLAPEYGAP
jgi:hypothetical protein